MNFRVPENLRSIEHLGFKLCVRAMTVSVRFRKKGSQIAVSPTGRKINYPISFIDQVERYPEHLVYGIGKKYFKSRKIFTNDRYDAKFYLPSRPASYYTRVELYKQGSYQISAERLIVGGMSEIYYSPDHYKSAIDLSTGEIYGSGDNFIDIQFYTSET